LKSLDFVRRLVEKGIDINARMTKSRAGVRTAMDFEGATAFLLAARTADADLMRLLLELGANPRIPNTRGTTPLLAAAGVGVQSPKEDPGSPEEVHKAVTIALEAGCDVNRVNSRGESVMHGAAYRFAASTIPLLAAHGAHIDVWNTKNKLGWTPLRIAVGVHRGMNLRSSPEAEQEIRKLMLAAGVSVRVEPETNISGATK
jgi:ankyrin repeat protein